MDLNIKPEMHNVTIFYYVFFAFNRNFTIFFATQLCFELLKIFDFDYFWTSLESSRLARLFNLSLSRLVVAKVL